MVENKKNKETEEKAVETKKEKSAKKPEKQEIKPKEKAYVYGKSLSISPKHCFAVCKMIKGKTPEKAVELLTNVAKGKIPVHMKNREVAHKKGKGVAGARYPKKASLEIIKLLKQVNANAVVNSIDNPVIFIAKANKASRPYRREGRRAKRTHVYIEVKDKTKSDKQKIAVKKL